MATYLLRVNWTWDDAAVPGGDTIVWGYHVDAATAPVANDFASAFINAGQSGTLTLFSRLPTALELDSFQVYDVVNGGPPVDEVLPVVPDVNSGGTPGATEVQVVVSRRVNDGLGRPFKKGRSYVGPFGASWMDSARPGASLTGVIGDFQLQLHANFILEGWTPVVDTKGALHVPETIVDYTIDDAWDTQRRRGLDPTTQTVFTPA